MSEGFTMEDLTLTMPYSQLDIEGMTELLDFDWEAMNNREIMNMSTETPNYHRIILEVPGEIHEKWQRFIKDCQKQNKEIKPNACFNLLLDNVNTQ